MGKKASLLYRIEPSENSYEPSYVFGTMHVRDHRVFAWTNQLRLLISSTQQFATEFHLEEYNNRKDLTHIQVDPDDAVSQVWSPKKFAKVKAQLYRSFGLNLSHYDRMRPIFAINALTASVLNQHHTQALDSYLWTQAAELDRQLSGIETVDEQIRTLQKIPLEVQYRQLISIAKQPSKFRSKVKQLITLYENQDVSRLFQLSKKSLGAEKSLLLYDRNLIMANRIQRIVGEASAFIAIGAAHLYGQKGVLRLLKKKGYNLVPMTLQSNAESEE